MVQQDDKKLSARERRKYLLSELKNHPRPWMARFKAQLLSLFPLMSH
jgi:hypothetical protein